MAQPYPDPSSAPPHRDLDYRPLSRPVGLGARLRAVAGHNRMLLAAVFGLLLVVAPVVAVVALRAIGYAGLSVLMLLLVSLGGVWVLAGVLRLARGFSRVRGFAGTNDLELLDWTLAEEYAGRSFASGTDAVQQAVRTREAAFVEIGDRIGSSAPVLTLRRSSRATRWHYPPRLYLRIRLVGNVAAGYESAPVPLPPSLQEALSRFAGEHSVEVAGNELTLRGERDLGFEDPDRVRTAFALADSLAEYANTALVGASPDQVAAGRAPLPSEAGSAPAARGARPLTVLASALVLLVLLPLAVAFVMANLDDWLGDDRTQVRIALGLLFVAVILVVRVVGRKALPPRHAKNPGLRR